MGWSQIKEYFCRAFPALVFITAITISLIALAKTAERDSQRRTLCLQTCRPYLGHMNFMRDSHKYECFCDKTKELSQ